MFPVNKQWVNQNMVDVIKRFTNPQHKSVCDDLTGMEQEVVLFLLANITTLITEQG